VSDDVTATIVCSRCVDCGGVLVRWGAPVVESVSMSATLSVDGWLWYSFNPSQHDADGDGVGDPW
jgi:hypothetical protein